MLAVCFVASPFYLRGAIAAFEAVDPALLDAARTLGAGPSRAFFARRAAARARRARRGLDARVRARPRRVRRDDHVRGQPSRTDADAAARDLRAFDVDFDVALALGALLVVVSAALLLAVKLIPSWTRSSSPSTTLFAPFASR